MMNAMSGMSCNTNGSSSNNDSDANGSNNDTHLPGQAQSSIKLVPTDLLGAILTFCSAQDLMQACNVCRQWGIVEQENRALLWLALYRRRWPAGSWSVASVSANPRYCGELSGMVWKQHYIFRQALERDGDGDDDDAFDDADFDGADVDGDENVVDDEVDDDDDVDDDGVDDCFDDEGAATGHVAGAGNDSVVDDNVADVDNDDDDDDEDAADNDDIDDDDDADDWC